MKKVIEHPAKMQFAAAGKKRFVQYAAFKKKDGVIKNIEIIVACLVAFIAGTGMYELFK